MEENKGKVFQNSYPIRQNYTAILLSFLLLSAGLQGVVQSFRLEEYHFLIRLFVFFIAILLILRFAVKFLWLTSGSQTIVITNEKVFIFRYFQQYKLREDKFELSNISKVKIIIPEYRESYFRISETKEAIKLLMTNQTPGILMIKHGAKWISLLYLKDTEDVNYLSELIKSKLSTL